MKLYLENVRSFDGWHEIPIAPATVLLGENSAGKSTLLGMLAVVHHEGFPASGNFFNQFPFEFGGYKTLATSKKGVTHFSVGFQTVLRTPFFGRSQQKEDELIPAGIISAFRENDGLPVLCHVFAWVGDFAISFSEQEFIHLDRTKQIGFPDAIRVESFVSPESSAHGLEMVLLRHLAFEKRDKRDNSDDKGRRVFEEIDDLTRLLTSGGFLRWGAMRAMAFAPMRSRPKRTYDQLSDEFSPEGDHIPLLLARAADPNNKQSRALHEALRDFGKYSEMFSDVDVKKLGSGSGDPFQVQVKTGTKKTNLIP